MPGCIQKKNVAVGLSLSNTLGCLNFERSNKYTWVRVSLAASDLVTAEHHCFLDAFRTTDSEDR